MQTNNILREALEALVDVVEAWQDHLPSAIREGEVSAALDKANAALAEPVRNCEVGTVAEQAKRFEEYCESEVCKRKRCKSRAKALCIERCALEWAQMPYEEGGAK